MTAFGYVVVSILLISMIFEIYITLKKGIKKTDFTIYNINHTKIEYGGVALIYALINIVLIVFLFLDPFGLNF